MQYHYFELNSQRYRAWRGARGRIYVEAITRLGLRLQTDPALTAYALQIIIADEQHDQKGN